LKESSEVINTKEPMKKRHSAEQIIRILKEVEASGLKVSEACRPHQVSEQTYYRWKQKYGGLDVTEARRLRELEEENQRLKRLVADQALDIQILKEVNSKKW
jgi:putative transposase